MKLSLFDYDLPKNLIAQTPTKPRDHSRLLVYDKKTKKVIHDQFFNLPNYLEKGDVLVFNNSKVFPARLLGKKETGGKAEALLLTQNFPSALAVRRDNIWEALIGTKNPKLGLKLRFPKGLVGELVNNGSDKTWLIKFNFKGARFNTILEQIGQIPLPPYIKPDRLSISFSCAEKGTQLKKQYQTIYAKKTGSAAAPTAGLHFTKKLLTKLKQKGIQFEYITLHVGLGTFNPVNTENIEDYQIHSEWVTVSSATIRRITKAKQEGRRIIAVGTTSVRTLESHPPVVISTERPFLNKKPYEIKRASGEISFSTNIFIYPGYKFKIIDAMITNFHLPKSSLLMLVSAFIGRTTALKLYKLAIKLKYRFFSFGDAMFLK